MELFQLRYFLEVARRQHVTKSARVLNVVQPAITQAINKLEDELGVKLFVHQGRNIKLTPCGSFMYEEIRPLMEHLDALPERMRDMAERESTTVHMNILSAWTLVTEAIIEYQRIDHLLQIELTETEQLEVPDISITTQQFCPPAVQKEYDNIHVYHEQIYLAVPNIPRYRNKKSISLQEVKDSRFVTLSGLKYFRTI